ncbi:unnamed protein product [Linum tenue]|uniref:C2 NT-type domain-containing protein n=1 Tax=Linum tenue TaxID=586396 RepID=A0AAV0HL71_9ROSI|nr:unnamed protein product [Linum tenue]
MAAAANSPSSSRRNSNTQLLEELEALSQSLYQTHTASTARRTNSLALPRTSLPSILSTDEIIKPSSSSSRSASRPRTRRMSLSPWRSRPKLDDDDVTIKTTVKPDGGKKLDDGKAAEKKGGIWNWKPIRALSHIGMQKLSCLFSVEVVAVQGLPSSMNGLRLSVCVRKKETKDGSVHTMPSRVSQGAADFEETLFIKCHVYYTNSSSSNKQLKFEPRVFYIYVFAVDAEELDFGRSSVDLSELIQESMAKNLQGTRIRQWDTTFTLAGKAKGAEVVLKLGFQIMEKDGGIDIYSQASQDQGAKASGSSLVKSFTPSFGRKQSKMSFSVTSPRITSRAEAWTPSQARIPADLQGIDDLNLDEPAPVVVPQLPPSSGQKKDGEQKVEEEVDLLPEFEVVDKGVEISQDKEEEKSGGDGDADSVENSEVKEIVHDQVHLNRLSELDSIAQQIKALESMMREEENDDGDDEAESQKLDAGEETVTKEFLQMLENEGEGMDGVQFSNFSQLPEIHYDSAEADSDSSQAYVSDLGKGLRCVVQTRDGGYLVAMNPLNDVIVTKKETPKLAMQLSRPLVLASTQQQQSSSSFSGFELFQKIAGVGFEELSSQILSTMPLDELMGKTAEQVAFEGIASAIIQGRNKEEVATSSAARTIASVKTMATAMSSGRKERISTGIWNVSEEPLTAEEVLAISLQKIEAMAIEGLRIQAEMADEEAPFDVSPVQGSQVLETANPLEDWIRRSEKSGESEETITIAVCVQLRDPLRRYEAVGGPILVIIHGGRVVDGNEKKYEEEKKFKVRSLHLGGMKVRSKGKRNAFDTERQRLTAMQWLVAYGIVKGGKKGKVATGKEQDVLWSISSRIMADMWLKSMRNPDVKLVVR